MSQACQRLAPNPHVLSLTASTRVREGACELASHALRVVTTTLLQSASARQRHTTQNAQSTRNGKPAGPASLCLHLLEWKWQCETCKPSALLLALSAVPCCRVVAVGPSPLLGCCCVCWLWPTGMSVCGLALAVGRAARGPSLSRGGGRTCLSMWGHRSTKPAAAAGVAVGSESIAAGSIDLAVAAPRW